MKPQMNANTRKLHDLGQRIWLDNITREMLNNGTLARYIAELSVTGLTSNPTIFEHAIGKYWEALERAMATQPQWAAHDRPQPELIWELIADIGLDMAQAKADASGPGVDQLLRQDVADMQALKVDRTPGFFVNGTPLRDFGEAQLRALVEQKLKGANGT